MRIAAVAAATANLFAIGNDAGALRAHAAQIDVAAPNWYALDRRGRLSGGPGDARYTRYARRGGAEVWPVVNARLGFRPGWLRERPRARVARRLAAIARAHDGVTLDVEEIPPQRKHAFSALVGAVARRAGGNGVAVYAVRRTAAPPLRSAAAYDWSALAKRADLVLGSTYGEHSPGTEPGPLTTDGGFDAVLAYAQGVSPRRVAPVLGAFGIAWPAGGGHGEVVSARGLPQGASHTRRGGHVVWYGRADDLRARRAAAARAGMRWVALFSLGREPAGFWR